jgi:hypothetical protein
MPEYLLEIYVGATDAKAAADSGRNARAAAAEMTRRGTPVCYRRWIYVPEDETCLFLFEADSAEAVCTTAQLAAIPCDRVTVAFTEPERTSDVKA